MEAAVFFMLAARLPAYQGVLAARLASEERGGKRSGGRAREAASYEQGSRYANRASTAASAPAATAGQLAALNMQLGGGWFAHRTVPAKAGD